MPASLRTIIVLRLLLASGVLGAVTLAEASFAAWPETGALRLLISLAYAVSLLTYLVWRLLGDHPALPPAQFAADVVIISGIVLLTDGLQSPFTFLYILPIIGAGMTLPRRISQATAALASLGYIGAALKLPLLGAAGPSGWLSRTMAGITAERSYLLFFHLSAFFLVAFLGSHLAEKLKAQRRELQETSDSLEELQELHTRLVTSMRVGLFTCDCDGRVTSLNQAAATLLGHSWPQVRGQSCATLFPGFPIKDFLETLCGPGAAATPAQAAAGRFVEGEFEHRGGATINLTMSLSPLLPPGGHCAGMVGIFQESTELHTMRQRLERADRLAAVGRLAAGIAHEIRNPLASLSGALQVLRGEVDLDATNARLLDIALREANRLSTTITEFLTYARPQAPEPQPFDLNILVKETLELLSNSPQYHPEISIEMACAPQPVVAEVDLHQLRQVLWNLCLNALQAFPAEGGMLRVSTGASGAGVEAGQTSAAPLAPALQARGALADPYVTLTIADTGVGIPHDLQQQVFEPFFSTKRYGSGLGLAVVHQIVTAHHGEIYLDSKPGRGTRFRIVLPARAPAGLGAAGPAPARDRRAAQP
ncbi:MAG: PAS domain-containing protein [Candidatus Tectomicrobia bacterium]|nr:PAS domain-containing protein [Candidatus Tectomicrobia bacterium]